ncbi:MAG: ThuA domain-containing protein [Deltaproteobacteria bacterium]|nr:ThuA domain-containing protein [Deltaproteobacteria bacterium]
MNSNSTSRISPYLRRVLIPTLLMALVLLLPFGAFAEQINVLFVANGYYQQENDIYSHLQDLAVFDVTIKKDYNINGSTDLTPYDLIIIAGFAPNISNNGLTNIENSDIPLLIIEYWDFWYSYKLGLLQWDSGDYYGTDTVEVIDDQHPITAGLSQSIEVHDVSYAVMYGASINSLSQDIDPLIYSLQSANEAAVIIDDNRKIVATGIYDTTHYTAEGWGILDRILFYLAPPTNTPDMVDVLFVTNGNYAQEGNISDRLDDLGVFNVTEMSDDMVNGYTYLASYDLIILTGFSPDVSNDGLSNISDAGVPVFLLSYDDFDYAHRLGLVSGDNGNYVSDNRLAPTVYEETQAFFVDMYLGYLPFNNVKVYDSSSSIYSIPAGDLEPSVTPLFGNQSSASNVVTFIDKNRRILSTSLFDTSNYTYEAWMLFDLYINYISPIGSQWQSTEEALLEYETSSLKSYLDAVMINPYEYNSVEVLQTIWDEMLKHGYFYITEAILTTFDYFDPPILEICWPCLLEYFKPASNESHEKREGRSCDDPDGVRLGELDCNNERLFLGQNYVETAAVGERYTTPNLGHMIVGSDLGVSAKYKNKLFFYMGDTWGCAAIGECISSKWTVKGTRNRFCSLAENQSDKACTDPWGTWNHHDSWLLSARKKPCDDAIVWSDLDQDGELARDLSEGIDIKVPKRFYFGSFSNWFRPLIMEGVNDTNADDGNVGMFNVPTGVGVLRHKEDDTDKDRMFLWYGTVGISRNHSFLSCSDNGLDFRPCDQFDYKKPEKFSPHDGTVPKFIQVSPVAITWEEIRSACDADSESILCDLDKYEQESSYKEAFLLFGAGEQYRCSQLYLAFMYINRQGTDDLNDDKVVVSYLKNTTWVSSEADAEPIIPFTSGECRTDFVNGMPTIYHSTQPKDAFGEFSVKKVYKGDTPHLIMLSNHNVSIGGCEIDLSDCAVGDYVQFRTATLAIPENWSSPEDTAADGYGPYFIDGFVFSNSDSGEIDAYHLISTWKGGKTFPNNHSLAQEDCYNLDLSELTDYSGDDDMGFYQDEPYGVFSRPLLLKSGTPPTL